MNGAVVVPTFGRAELLDKLLASLAALDPAPPLVLLVDGNEAPLALPHQRPASLEVVREPNQGPAHARNTGIAAARQAGVEVAVFTDDDAVVPPGWFGRHMALHDQHREAGAVGGPTTNLRPGHVVADYTQLVVFGLERPDEGPVRTTASVNMSYKLACLDEVGGFPEDIKLPGGEEVDLHWRITEAGWSIWYDPALTVGHHFHTSWRPFLRQQRAYGRGFVQTRWRWRDMPGGDFITMPWWRAIAGSAPYIVRQARRTTAQHGIRLLPASLARESVYRTAALIERRRLERVDHDAT